MIKRELEIDGISRITAPSRINEIGSKLSELAFSAETPLFTIPFNL
jgi:hypothetical protein